MSNTKLTNGIMGTLTIEGFKVESDINSEFPEDELIGCGLLEFIEEVGINEIPVATYFYNNCRGYKNRSLEPFNWRANKSSIVMRYTGANGGEMWTAKVFI